MLQAELARRRARAQREASTARPPRRGGLLEAFDARLPFDLTPGQLLAGAQIGDDLALDRPMQRLLQGEVGSGKTVVALRAMLQVIDAGGQAAMLAPTSVLAAQHVRTLRALLGDLAEGGMLGGSEIGTRVALLTGAQGAAERKTNLLDAASGQAGIVVGTHALLSEPGAVRGPRARRDRRAAQVRRRAARRAAGQGEERPAPAGHDGHADPAHGRDDGVRRARDLRAARGARRAQRDHDARGAGGRPGLDGPDVATRAARRSRAAGGRSSSARGSTRTTTRS